MSDEQTFYNLKRLHAVFALSAVVLLAVTIAAMLVDARRPWKQYQRTFHEQNQRDADAPSAWQPQIEQIDLPDLPIAGQAGATGRVDRCRTCHQGIDRTLPGGGSGPAYPECATTVSLPSAAGLDRRPTQSASAGAVRLHGLP